MDAIIDLSWRMYPALALMAAGLALATLGTRHGVHGIALPVRDPSKILTIMTGFRLAVIGLAVAAIAAAWAWHILWLLVLALAIGGEETLESSIHIFALTKGKNLRLRYPA